MARADLLLHGASQVVTVDGGGRGARRGAAAMNDLGVIEDGSVAVRGGKVVAVGPSRALAAAFRGARRLSCRGRTLLPGFVDAHTHPAFARTREDEFARRCRGADYEEILACGGGIHASARALADMPRAELARAIVGRFDAMLRHGTTAVEAKSGYGLSTAAEVKSLEAIGDAAAGHPVTVARTFLGAHVVPEAYAKRRSAYVDLVCREMIPLVARRKLATFCDVFVEQGAFRVPEARKVLRAGRAAGLVPKVHADQFRCGGGARLAAEMRAISAEHVDATDAAGIRALAGARVIAVLLPSAGVFTGLRLRPDARGLIEAGCAVALSTDFNPGTSPSENLALTASLGCSLLGMTPEEVVCAITRNAAAACGLDDAHGRIAVGRPANLVVLDAPSYELLPYRMGTNLVERVLVGGRTVVLRGRRVAPRAAG